MRYQTNFEPEPRIDDNFNDDGVTQSRPETDADVTQYFLKNQSPRTMASSLRRSSEQFEAFQPKNLCHPRTTHDIIYARHSRDNSPDWSRKLQNQSISKPRSKSAFAHRSNSLFESNSSLHLKNSSEYHQSVNTTSGLSLHLQLDQDRYVDRLRTFEELERKKRREQEEYENYLRQRALRASKEGSTKEFQELFRRNQEWKQTTQEKRALMQKQLLDKEVEEVRKYHQKLIEHISKPLPKFDRGWSEIQMEENQKRQERIERRKNELLSRSKSPSLRHLSQPQSQDYTSRAPSIERSRIGNQNQNYFADRSTASGTSHRRSQSRFKVDAGEYNDSKLQQKSITNEEFVAVFEQRQKQYEEKMRLRQIRKAEREKFEEDQKRARAKERMAKLIHEPLPAGCDRRTRATEEREKTVRARLEKKRLEAERKARKDELARLSQLRLGQVLRTVITLNELDRKAKHGGYVELSRTRDLSKERAKKSREEFVSALKTNRSKIIDAVDHRPTLLQRHSEMLAKQLATKRAQEKIALITKSIASGDSFFSRLPNVDSTNIATHTASATRSSSSSVLTKVNHPSASTINPSSSKEYATTDTTRPVVSSTAENDIYNDDWELENAVQENTLARTTALRATRDEGKAQDD